MDRFNRGSRQHVCYMVVFALNMSNIRGEFEDIGKVSLLSASLWVPYFRHTKYEGFVVSVCNELSSFQEISEVPYSWVEI